MRVRAALGVSLAAFALVIRLRKERDWGLAKYEIRLMASEEVC